MGPATPVPPMAELTRSPSSLGRSSSLSRSSSLQSRSLRTADETPNTPNWGNACPAPEVVRRSSLKRPKHFAFEDEKDDDTFGPRQQRLALYAFVVAAAACWWCLVRASLKHHRFPFHRHRVEITLLYTVPPTVFGALMVRSTVHRSREEKASVTR